MKKTIHTVQNALVGLRKEGVDEEKLGINAHSVDTGFR